MAQAPARVRTTEMTSNVYLYLDYALIYLAEVSLKKIFSKGLSNVWLLHAPSATRGDGVSNLFNRGWRRKSEAANKAGMPSA